MTHILSAGDHFVSPALFAAALREELPGRPLTFTDLLLPWPHEPFGDVGGVTEASDRVEELVAALPGAEVCVTQMAPFTATVLEGAPELRMVAVCRGGPVNVDLAAATQAGVVVSYAPARNAQAAAEFTVGLVLAAMRRLVAADAELKAGTWRGDYYTYDNAGSELGGATVGLVGYGAIGRIVARVLAALGATVLAADPYADPAVAAADGVQLLELDDLLARSSVVSLHARLTPQTRHLLDERRLALLPHGAVLVNGARGGLLDYGPLPAMLASGRLGALGLDVYDVEPPPADWPLRSAPNVVLSPHLAGATRQTAQRAARIVADDVAAFLAGRAPRAVANPAVLERTGLAAVGS